MLWYALIVAALCLSGSVIVTIAWVGAAVAAHVQANGYAQFQCGPLWVLLMPGYISLSW